MKGVPSRRDRQKYCKFHKDIGHNNNNCRALKDAIENLIKKGHLKEFVKGNQAPNKQNGQSGQPQPPLLVNDVMVRMIYGGAEVVGNFRHARGQYAQDAKTDSVPKVLSSETRPPKQSKTESEVIGFIIEESDLVPCHNHDMIIIVTRVDNGRVYRIMVDNKLWSTSSSYELSEK
ncbi:uncharacterized protein LOC116109944 [Pistacia vera]|uniref:uncharacterized protein LOC116109944 n=1 Tax=Pistacia vera TaxID=55513 RepID=UPI0012630E91|nr:uncharacterized protein LOC116109944 [Pistacia vera]